MTHALRDRVDWLVVWLLAAALTFGLVVLWMASSSVDASGDALGAAALFSLLIGLAPALIYWALGAERLRWRLWRLLVALLYVLFLIAGAGAYVID